MDLRITSSLGDVPLLVLFRLLLRPMVMVLFGCFGCFVIEGSASAGEISSGAADAVIFSLL